MPAQKRSVDWAAGIIRFPGNFCSFSQRLTVRFALACRVGRRAKCCTASEVPWTDRSIVEEFDVHPAKSCKTKSAPGHARLTAAAGGIMQGPHCKPPGGCKRGYAGAGLTISQA